MLLLLVVSQTLVIYIFLVFILSRVGRSFMAGLTHFDYLIVALLGSAVETGLYRGSNSMTAGLASATTLILANRIMSSLMNRWPRLRRILAGGPVVLVHDGQLVVDRLREAHLSEQDVLAAVRRRGYCQLEEIRLAILEQNGQVGVIPIAERRCGK